MRTQEELSHGKGGQDGESSVSWMGEGVGAVGDKIAELCLRGASPGFLELARAPCTGREGNLHRENKKEYLHPTGCDMGCKDATISRSEKANEEGAARGQRKVT